MFSPVVRSQPKRKDVLERGLCVVARGLIDASPSPERLTAVGDQHLTDEQVSIGGAQERNDACDLLGLGDADRGGSSSPPR